MNDGSPTDRLDWLRAVIIQCSDKSHRVAAAIEGRWNRNSGVCWPSHAQLAADARMSEDSVIRGVRELVSAGFLEVRKPDRQGRGLANEYRPIWEAGSPRRTAPLCYQKPPQNCPPLDEKGSQPSGERVANRTPKGGAELRPQLREENPENEPRENPTAAPEEKTDLFDKPDEQPKPLTDRELIQPLQGIARWLSSDPERTQTNIATMAALVREFGAQEVERHAKALFRLTGEKSWPEAIGQAIAADRAAKRKPRPPPEPGELNQRRSPQKEPA